MGELKVVETNRKGSCHQKWNPSQKMQTKSAVLTQSGDASKKVLLTGWGFDARNQIYIIDKRTCRRASAALSYKIFIIKQYDKVMKLLLGGKVLMGLLVSRR